MRIPLSLARLGAHLPGSLGASFDFVARRAGLEHRDRQVGDLERTVRRLLRFADRAFARGDLDSTTGLLVKVFELTHHVEVRHDPLRFAQILCESKAIRRLGEPSENLYSSGTSSQAPPGRPVRLLVVAHRSFTFVDRVIALLEERGIAECRRVDLAEHVEADDLRMHSLIWARLAGETRPLPESMRTDVEWAEAIFVEWGHHALVWASIADFGELPVYGRFHRFEAFTAFPLLIDFSRLAHTVFVADHVRALLLRLRPDLESSRTSVITNALDTDKFALPKLEGAHNTAILVGWNRPVKDPSWALEVLLEVRRTRPEFHLLLAGEAPRDWESIVAQDLRDTGAVELLGQRDDMPSLFRRAGFVLSASRHEGTHEAIAEGAASGAIPIVRDWPEAREFGGARSVYPEEWVVESPQEAARKICALLADPELYQSHASSVRQWIRESRGGEKIARAYADMLTGSAHSL